MNRHEYIQQLFTELSALKYDLRAEAIVCQLRQQAGAGDVVAINDGRFYREYRRDLYHNSMEEDTWHNEFLQLHLSRAGLYDNLPEGLFHQSTGDKASGSAGEMAAISRRDKKKETEARKFFQPLENSFFFQRLQVEKEEEELLAGADDGAMAAYLFRFWELPEELHTRTAALFIRLLPYAHIINSNLPLMQDCLFLLLNEEVVIAQTEAPDSHAQVSGGGLGTLELGNDMVCGNTFFEDYTCLQYDIGPLQHTGPAGYVEGGQQHLLLELFNSYFAPAEADIIINIEVDRSKAIIAFDEEHAPILGYASML